MPHDAVGIASTTTCPSSAMMRSARTPVNAYISPSPPRTQTPNRESYRRTHRESRELRKSHDAGAMRGAGESGRGAVRSCRQLRRPSVTGTRSAHRCCPSWPPAPLRPDGAPALPGGAPGAAPGAASGGVGGGAGAGRRPARSGGGVSAGVPPAPRREPAPPAFSSTPSAARGSRPRTIMSGRAPSPHTSRRSSAGGPRTRTPLSRTPPRADRGRAARVM